MDLPPWICLHGSASMDLPAWICLYHFGWASCYIVSDEAKKILLDCYCYTISVLVYNREFWKTSSQIEKRVDGAETWFHKRIPRIPRTVYVSSHKYLSKIETKGTPIFYIRKRQLEFLGHTRRKAGPENLTLTWHIDQNGGREKQRIIYLISKKEIQCLLKATKDKN